MTGPALIEVAKQADGVTGRNGFRSKWAAFMSGSKWIGATLKQICFCIIVMFCK